MQKEEKYKQTVMSMGKKAYRDMVGDMEGFIGSRGLEFFGAGISGVGQDKKTLARKVLEFIYLENAKVDLEALEDEDRF